MRTVILVALLALFTTAFAHDDSDEVPNERERREACSFDAAGVRECLDKQAKESEAILKAAEADFLTALGRWDTDAKFAKQTRQRLSEASAAFVQYRAAQCSFAASLGAGAIGNALEVRRLACVAELNQRRAHSLEGSALELRLR